MAGSRSGPVRSEVARRSILAAAAQILTERGYAHLTMEGIAARAGVGKQTIYRWWPSKGDVVAECLLEGMLLPERLTVPDTGDVRRDLATWMGSIADILDGDPGEGILRSLIAAATQNADVGGRLRDSLAGADSIAGRLQSAVGTAPHLTPATPVTELAEALVGAIILRVLSRAPLDGAAIRDILAAVLGPEDAA
ncbi:TetR/AcrR family transcriptional regulator [Microbacterium sp. JZ31]|uniref:TetR/AcrR family transcriptional regulator n=1 Tax=Microbacterium sp. JZ31 TaxID=1906274 RepID=UPI0019347FBB|nr:TetR/AcrR family transcriptional regulator [Microbacterium sp. JZ31]